MSGSSRGEKLSVPGTSERDFQRWVVDVARSFGWRYWHVPMPVRPVGDGKFVPDSRGAGLPDLVLMHNDPPRLIFAELKGAGGKIRPDQAEFLRLARDVRGAILDLVDASLNRSPLPVDAPLGVYTWRPGAEALIEAILRGRTMVA